MWLSCREEDACSVLRLNVTNGDYTCWHQGVSDAVNLVAGKLQVAYIQ